MVRVLVALSFLVGGVVVSSAQIRYDAVAPSHLAKVSTSLCRLDKSLKTLPPEQVASPMGTWTAVVEVTDPVVVPYDQARGCIKVTGRAGNRAITIGDFRTLQVSWINERLLYVFTDVGHIAGVGQLLDVDDAKWIYAKTEFYTDPARTEPPAARR